MCYFWTYMYVEPEKWKISDFFYEDDSKKNKKMVIWNVS